MDSFQISILTGAISGTFLVFTLHNMFKGKLFWLADRGVDLGITILAPILLGGGTASGAAMALAFGVMFTVTLRVAHMFLPGQYLQFVIEKGWPKLRWINVPPKKFEMSRRSYR